MLSHTRKSSHSVAMGRPTLQIHRPAEEKSIVHRVINLSTCLKGCPDFHPIFFYTTHITIDDSLTQVTYLEGPLLMTANVMSCWIRSTHNPRDVVPDTQALCPSDYGQGGISSAWQDHHSRILFTETSTDPSPCQSLLDTTLISHCTSIWPFPAVPLDVSLSHPPNDTTPLMNTLPSLYLLIIFFHVPRNLPLTESITPCIRGNENPPVLSGAISSLDVP